MKHPHWFRYILYSGLTGFLLTTATAVYGQPFEPVSMPFAPAGRSAMAWCDFDMDGDLDVFLSGIGSGDMRVSALYRNDDGIFTNTMGPFIPVKESSAAWGDYDRDGDQDLLLAGNSENGDITRIYRNDGNGFTEVNPGIVPVQQGDVCWIDVDRDNDLDIFITGNWFAKIYLNQEGNFTDSGQNFGLFSSSAASWGDFDRDGDPDLLLTGDTGAGGASKIFRNNAGQFEDILAGLPGLLAGTADWIDYDNDGDLDVAISGFDDALEAKFYLYRNQDKLFEIVYAGIDGFALGTAAWADYDLDGDTDLLMSGKATGCGAYVSGIYRNDGNDVFFKISSTFTTVTRGSAAWADYDNDGDPDFFICGLNANDQPYTALYRNQAGSNEFTANTPPVAPEGMSSTTDDDRITLEWLPASDDQTPAEGLNYNLAIGLSPMEFNILSPMADPASGQRFISRVGNAGQCLSATLEDLLPGTYYWTVQSIDQAFLSSGFAPVQSFTITATGQDETMGNPCDISLSPNPASGFLRVDHLPSDNPATIVITDFAGRSCFTGQIDPRNPVISIKGLPAGVYLVGIHAAGKSYSEKFLKIAD